MGGSGGGGTMFGELRSPYDAAWTGTPSMLTATPKAKSPEPSRRSCRYSSTRAHSPADGMASVPGVAARTEVVGASTVVAAAVGDAAAGAESRRSGATPTVPSPGIDAVAVFVVCGAASGREAAHAAAPVVTSRAATTDA